MKAAPDSKNDFTSNSIEEIIYKRSGASDDKSPHFELRISGELEVRFVGIDNCNCSGEHIWTISDSAWKEITALFSKLYFNRMKDSYMAVYYPPQDNPISSLSVKTASGLSYSVSNTTPAGFNSKVELSIDRIDQLLRHSWGELLYYLEDTPGKWKQRHKGSRKGWMKKRDIKSILEKRKSDYHAILRLIYLEERVLRAADIHRCVTFPEWTAAVDPENFIPEQ